MRYTVAFRLRGALSEAVAVEWTDAADPQASARGWEACVRLGNGDWRFASHDIEPEAQAHWREPGLFGNIGLRYRLSPAGSWSPVSESRKEIVLVAVTGGEAMVPPALESADWSALEPVDLGGDNFTGVFALQGAAAVAVAVEWSASDSEWRPCVVLGDARWRLGGAEGGTGHLVAAGESLGGIGVRYRLAADGAWSPVSRDRRRLVVPAGAGPEILVPPALILVPALAGTGKIGAEVTVTPGTWAGVPAPDLALQWCRDGVDIPSAVAAVYVPGAEDDLTDLTCRITASSRAGTATAASASLRVTHVAPEVVGTPVEEIFDQGSGAQDVACAGYFTGEALVFGVAGAGAGVDAATGVVSIPTGNALSGETVTVTATNSGGSAQIAFMMTVEAAEPQEVLLTVMTAADWEVRAVRDALLPDAPLIEMIHVLSGPALKATRLYRTVREDTTGFYPGYGFQICIRHPEFDDPESAFHQCWMGRRNGARGDHFDLAGRDTQATILRYTLDPEEIPLEEAVFSDDSDRKVWTIADIAAPAPEQPAPPAGQPSTPSGWKALPALDEAEYNAFMKNGILSGDAGQYMLGAAQSESDPDRIYTCQDSGGVWVSLDHGNSWNNLRNRGLHARFTTGIAVDPVDNNRVFVITQGGGYQAAKYIGLQRSLDGGLNWERAIANTESPGRSTQSPINFAPSSADRKRGYATRWYCIIQSYSYRNDTKKPHEFHMSDDGGATWTKIRELAVDTYKSISHLVVSPVDPNVVYVYGGNGLWRFNAANKPGGGITRMTGSGGLPAGGFEDRLYISADGKTMIGGASKGIYRSTDTGASWSQIYADGGIGKLHVNPWDPQRMILTYGKGTQMKYSTNGGKSFAKPDTVNTGPGGDNGGMIHEGSALVVWHPANPDRVWAHGGPTHWQSDNGGRDWRPANGYFNGKQHQNWFIDQMFDPRDANRFGYFMTDFGVGVTDDRGLSFRRGRMKTVDLGLKHSTVNGGAIHPDPAKGIILASVGKMTSGKLVVSRDDGATWKIASDGDRKRQYVGYDLDDPRYCFQWRERSIDHGLTWSTMGSLPKDFAVSGMTLTAKGLKSGQAIFAIDRDGGGNSKILRSLDRGASWQTFINAKFNFGVSGMTGGGPCRAHPFDPDIFFTKGPDERTIRKWTPGGKTAFTDYNVMGGYPGGDAPDGMFSIMSLAIDRRFPQVMYAMNAYDHVPYKFFRTTDGGLTWENITEGFPGTFIRGLEVSPVTGEVFIGSPNGSRIFPAPYAAPAGATTGGSNVWGQHYLDRAY